MISLDTDDHLKRLGKRLRNARIKRDEVQQRFAARLGISVPTLRKMENGEATVSIGLWAEALHLFGRIDELDKLFEERMNLFEKRDALSLPQRKRASKRKD